MKIVLNVCGLLVALVGFSTATAIHTIARVEVQAPADWASAPTYCVASNGQVSVYGWAENGHSICIAGYFVSPGTYHVTTFHAGKWTQPQPIAEVVNESGVQLQPPGNSFSLPESSYTVNVVLSD